MAQCEKILTNGQRCSNQAVPGARYCETHGRITFKPVAKPADTAPPPVEKAVRPAPKRQVKPSVKKVASAPAPSPTWQAVPSPTGKAPRFPGLTVAERGLLVASQGLIWLEPSSQPASPDTFTRLVRMLGALSQAVNLAGQVRLTLHSSSSDYLIHLSPSKDANLTAFYDAASAAARLVDARMYIGQTPAYVQYRDDRAPRGYDVPDFKATHTKDLLLVAHWGSRTFAPADLKDVPLDEFCLQVTPLAGEPSSPPETLYALAPVGLYQLLARYLRAHHLRYSLARFQSGQGELLLFEISPRPGAPAGPRVPAFVQAHLARLPRLALLTLAHQEGKQTILLHLEHQYPLQIGHIARIFPADGFLLLVGDPYHENLLVDPSPKFFDGDSLAHVHTPQRRSLHLSQKPEGATSLLDLPVLLRPDDGPIPPIHALLLNAQETLWLRQLLYRLPGEIFGDYRLCQGENMSVLLAGAKAIQGIPFGLPFRRLGDAPLFIPLRSHFAPDLPWHILKEALRIDETQSYTFLTFDSRLDLPQRSFFPLSRLLVADPGRPLVKFSLRTDIGLPPLRWVLPERPEPPAVKESAKAPSRRPRILDGWRERAQRRTADKAPSTEQPPVQLPPVDPLKSWREQAQTFEADGDFLAAAMCYALVNDATASSRCLQRSLIAQTHTGAQK